MVIFSLKDDHAVRQLKTFHSEQEVFDRSHFIQYLKETAIILVYFWRVISF